MKGNYWLGHFSFAGLLLLSMFTAMAILNNTMVGRLAALILVWAGVLSLLVAIGLILGKGESG